MSHTEEPWRYQTEVTRSVGLPVRTHHQIYKDKGVYGHPATCDSEEDARRIVACINALAGVPTGDLEARPELYRAAPRMLEALQNICGANGPTWRPDCAAMMDLARAAIKAATPD